MEATCHPVSNQEVAVHNNSGTLTPPGQLCICRYYRSICCLRQITANSTWARASQTEILLCGKSENCLLLILFIVDYYVLAVSHPSSVTGPQV